MFRKERQKCYCGATTCRGYLGKTTNQNVIVQGKLEEGAPEEPAKVVKAFKENSVRILCFCYQVEYTCSSFCSNAARNLKWNCTLVCSTSKIVFDLMSLFSQSPWLLRYLKYDINETTQL